MNTFWGVNLYASIFTMTLMSVDRYLAVVHPLTSISYRTCRNALVVCAVIWLFGFLFVLPLCLYSTVSRNQCLVRVTFSQFVTLRSACLFIGTARIVCGSGSMKRHGVCPFVCPSMGPQQQTRCCRFAVVGSAGRRYRSIGARVVSLRRLLNTDLFIYHRTIPIHLLNQVTFHLEFLFKGRSWP